MNLEDWMNRELDNCNYLMENTKYSNSSLETYGYWLETPSTDGSSRTWDVDALYRSVGYNASASSNYGVRPAIEVLKSEIQY